MYYPTTHEPCPALEFGCPTSQTVDHTISVHIDNITSMVLY